MVRLPFSLFFPAAAGKNNEKGVQGRQRSAIIMTFPAFAPLTQKANAYPFRNSTSIRKAQL